MKTLNRIKLTQEFQDLTTLITDYSDDNTYILQVQAESQIEIVESATEPEIELTGSLPANVGRLNYASGSIITFKGDGTNGLWVRANFGKENYISVVEAEAGV